MGEPAKLDRRVSRRAAIRFLGKGAAVAAVGGLLAFQETGHRYIRPRGALPEEEFLSVCIRCPRCIDACPYCLISAVPLSESIVAAGTPALQTYCSRCSRCVDACPVGALQSRR